MIKPFSNLLFKKDKNITPTKSDAKEEELTSKPLIIFGIIISLTSIFLLLFTIKSRFG